MTESIADLLGKKKDKKDDTSAQGKFDKKMLEIRLKEKEIEAEVKAKQMRVEYIDLAGFPISAEAITLIPRQQAEGHKIVAFLYNGEETRVGALDPKDPALEDIVYQAEERGHAKVKVYLISENSFKTAMKIYDALPEIVEIKGGVEITAEDLEKMQAELTDMSSLNEHIQKVSTTDFVTFTIAAALKFGTSDIHIEAGEKEVVIRMRIDGVLDRAASVKKDMWPRIVNRFKLFSGLKINITTVPQDGRFTIFLGEDNKVDVRVSTLPTAYGESIVMRLLKSESVGLPFEDLGIRGIAYDHLKAQIERPTGMIVTTGPTGSGKTTTLYAILNKLNDGHNKIITMEDPIEFKLKGISQSQIDKAKDYTFDKGLHSILRQDPDIVMVGEIRELATGEVAIQAALTGHLMISTIHTNSAAGAIPRFLSMGLKPFLLAPALNAVVGQRLVRRIHQDCKEPFTPPPEHYEKARKILEKLSPKSGYDIDLDNMKFFHGKGCKVCNGKGLKGRQGIYEILTMSEAVEKVILSGKVSEYEMEKIAIEAGMVTMAQDGILKALDGITTLEEVFAVAE